VIFNELLFLDVGFFLLFVLFLLIVGWFLFADELVLKEFVCGWLLFLRLTFMD